MAKPKPAQGLGTSTSPARQMKPIGQPDLGPIEHFYQAGADDVGQRSHVTYGGAAAQRAKRGFNRGYPADDQHGYGSGIGMGHSVTLRKG
jgi:hypothetical protein